jgi:CYTH domain-containing protein/predicted ATPase
MSKRVTPIEIVLTGGPAAGKTTALARLAAKLSDWGFRVLLAPEVATIVISGGLQDIGAIAGSDQPRFVAIEGELLLFQRALRERYRALAEAIGDERTVIIYDRGEMDVQAYLGRETFSALSEELRLTTADMRDSYDGVIHMVSSAVGAPQAYTTANNVARRETIDEAAALDAVTLAAWVGHPHLRIIDNTTNFDAKIRKTVAAVARMVGVPEPLEIERRFLLDSAPSAETLAALGATPIPIEQVYLASDDPGREVRIRRRGVPGAAVHFRTEKVRIDAVSRHETERIISPTEYRGLLSSADPSRAVIRKTRHCFPYKGAYLELDVFDAPAGLTIVEVELVEASDAVVLPEVLGRAIEITGDDYYTNASIARDLKSA